MNARVMALALAGSLLLAGCGGAAPAASPSAPAPPASKPAASPSAARPIPLTVAYTGVSGGDLPLWMADETGIFKRNGLDTKVTIASSNSAGMVADLVAGQLQVVWTDGTNAVGANANGADLVIVAMIHPAYAYLLMAPASIKAAADLKGQKIAVSSLTGTDAIATRLALAKLGIDPQKDVTLVAVGSNANRVAALSTGAAQGSLLDPPGTLKLEASGFHSVADLSTMNLPSTNASLIVQRSYLTSNRPAVQKFVDSIVEAIALEKKHKATALKLLKKYEKSDDDHAMEVTYDYYTPLTPGLPFPKQDIVASAVAQLAGANPKLKDVDLSRSVDPSLVQSAADHKIDQ